MKSLKEFRPLLKLVKEDLNKLIFASIIIFISGICEVFTGYLNGKVVEEITMLDIKNALIFLGIYFVLEITMDGVILHYANSILYKEESKLTRKLGFYTYKKALCLPPVAYEKMSSGEIINRITSDADTLSFAFGRLLNMISSLVASIIVIVYVFINSWIIGLEIVGIVSILFLILKKYNPLLKDIHKERRKEQDKFTSLTTESIRGIREIKTLGIKNNLISDMTSIIKDIYNKSSKEIDIQKSFNIKTRLLKSILECSVFATCVILLYYKMISLTFFIAMTYYVYRFTWLIENINDLTQTYQKVSVSISRVNDILENRLYKDEEFGNKKLVNVKGVIEFKDVNFNYPPLFVVGKCLLEFLGDDADVFFSCLFIIAENSLFHLCRRNDLFDRCKQLFRNSAALISVFRFSNLCYDAVDEFDDFLVYFVCFVDGVDHFCFRNLFCSGFDHDDFLSGGSYGQFQVGYGFLCESRVYDELAVDHTDLSHGTRTVKRDVGNAGCDCGTQHCDYFRITLRIYGHHHVV